MPIGGDCALPWTPSSPTHTGSTARSMQRILASFSHKSFPAAPALCLAAFDELAGNGLAPFCRDHDPYFDIPLVTSLARAGHPPMPASLSRSAACCRPVRSGLAQPAREAYQDAKQFRGKRWPVEAESFDYIVTGAGSAGCAVAARLSESGRYRVLLLEAGGKDRNPWIHIPMGFSQVYANPRVNWMYESEPEAQLGGRTLYQPRGKVLGGTSSINGMVYMRGNAADYDEWRQRGCTGWDWDSVLPYFKKAEHQERGANEFHGVGGPLHVSDQPHRSELADRAGRGGDPGRACRRSTTSTTARQEGAGYFQSTTGKRRRWSTATAYLRPARSRSNLVVRPNAHATRILIEDGRAAGVTYVSGGVTRTARASGEVIVCGGVFNSPQLLQLSGIGPGALLQEMGIAGDPRPAGGRQASAGPLLRPAGVPLHQADHDERAGQQPAAQGAGDGAVRAVPLAARWRPTASPRARSRAAIRAWNGPTCSSTSRRGAMPRATPAVRWRIRFPASA